MLSVLGSRPASLGPPDTCIRAISRIPPASRSLALNLARQHCCMALHKLKTAINSGARLCPVGVAGRAKRREESRGQGGTTGGRRGQGAARRSSHTASDILRQVKLEAREHSWIIMGMDDALVRPCVAISICQVRIDIDRGCSVLFVFVIVTRLCTRERAREWHESAAQAATHNIHNIRGARAVRRPASLLRRYYYY